MIWNLQSDCNILMFSQLLQSLPYFISKIAVPEFSKPGAISRRSVKQCVQQLLCCNLLLTVPVLAVSYLLQTCKTYLLLVKQTAAKRLPCLEAGAMQLMTD